MSRSFSLLRAITSSWAFLRLEDDSSSRAMFASFSLMAASSACCLREQWKGNEGQVTHLLFTSEVKTNTRTNGLMLICPEMCKVNIFYSPKLGRWMHIGTKLTSAVACVHMQMSH